VTDESDDQPIDDALGRLSQQVTDREAWRVLVSGTWPSVLGFARHSLGSTATADKAEDVAQEVYLHLSSAWHAGQLRPPANRRELLGLLATLARNSAFDMIRKSRRKRRDANREVAFDAIDNYVGTKSDVELAADANELLEELRARLDAFDCRLLDLLVSGAPLKTIAWELEASPRTIQRHQDHIRGVLKQVQEESS